MAGKDRSHWQVSVKKLGEEDFDEEVLAMTPAQRLGLMRILALNSSDPQERAIARMPLQRNVVRVIRLKKGPDR